MAKLPYSAFEFFQHPSGDR